MASLQKMRIEIAPWTLFAIGVAGVVFWGFLKIFDIVLVVLTSVVIASFVQSAARNLYRFRVPRVGAIVMVYVLMAISVTFLLYLMVPVLLQELVLLADFLPEDTIFTDLVIIFGDFLNAREALSPDGVGATSSMILDVFGQMMQSLGSGLIASLSNAFGGIINATLIIVISFYLAIMDEGLERFLRAVTPIQHETYVISLWKRTEEKIGAWFQGQLILAMGLAVATYIGLVLMGVPYALMLSLVALVFGLIPFGIFIATVPAVIVAFSTGGLSLALFVLGYYTFLQQIQDYVFGPMILRRATGVPSVGILVAVVVGAKLAGFLGFFLGLPLAILISEGIGDYEGYKAGEIAKKKSKKKAKA